MKRLCREYFKYFPGKLPRKTGKPLKQHFKGLKKLMLNIIEEMAKGRIESQYLTDKKYSFSIALESVSDTDWFWTPEEHEKFDFLWNGDVPIEKMARILKRSELAVFLNAMDRMANGFIKSRQGWKIW